jgi:hypothetical protein
VTRAKVLVRAKREDRERLVGKTPEELAANVVGVGEEMARDVRRIATLRDTAPDSMGASLEREAWMLSHARADLLVICDEMRSRINHLLDGRPIGTGRPARMPGPDEYRFTPDTDDLTGSGADPDMEEVS